MAKKSDGVRKPPVQMKLLSEEDKASLREQARKSLLAEMEQDARDEYFKTSMEELRRDQTPEDRFVQVQMDLAPFASKLTIDGNHFWHGCTYTVPTKQAAVLYEQMQRGWMHQDEIDGRSRFNAYRKPQNVRLGPHSATPTVGANGTVSVEL